MFRRGAATDKSAVLLERPNVQSKPVAPSHTASFQSTGMDGNAPPARRRWTQQQLAALGALQLLLFAALPRCALCAAASDAAGLGAAPASVAAALLDGKAALSRLEHGAAARPCQLRAVRKLKSSCAEMPEAARAKLAFDLANCHWEASRKPTRACDGVLEGCVSRLSDADFAVYTQFKIAVGTICQFLAHDQRQRELALHVDKLRHAARRGPRLLLPCFLPAQLCGRHGVPASHAACVPSFPAPCDVCGTWGARITDTVCDSRSAARFLEFSNKCRACLLARVLPPFHRLATPPARSPTSRRA